PLLRALIVDPGIQQRWRWEEMLRTNLPVDLIARAIKLDLGRQAAEFRDQPQRLSAYLDCVERLQASPVPNLNPDAAWLMGLFLAGRRWAIAAALVLLNRQRLRSKQDDVATSLFALGRNLTGEQSLVGPGRVLHDALEDWNEPTVHQPPPHLDTLAELLVV